MLITFSSEDINLTSFPHTDAMATIVHIDIWDVTKILTNKGSQAEILLLATFNKMGFDRKQFIEPSKHLYGFGGKRIKLVGAITLPVSFGTAKNPRTKYIAFDVVDMAYPYNAIFGRGFLNTFEVCMVDLRSSQSQQTCHRTTTASQPKHKTPKTEASQNGGRKNAGNEGLSPETARCRFHKRGDLS
jgi:hypothetical protein